MQAIVYSFMTSTYFIINSIICNRENNYWFISFLLMLVVFFTFFYIALRFDGEKKSVKGIYEKFGNEAILIDSASGFIPDMMRFTRFYLILSNRELIFYHFNDSNKILLNINLKDIDNVDFIEKYNLKCGLIINNYYKIYLWFPNLWYDKIDEQCMLMKNNNLIHSLV